MWYSADKSIAASSDRGQSRDTSSARRARTLGFMEYATFAIWPSKVGQQLADQFHPPILLLVRADFTTV